MSKPEVILGGFDAGAHNAEIDAAAQRIEKSQLYRDLSTIMVMPTRGVIPARVVEALLALVSPPNNGFFRMFISGMEVGAAYEHALDLILGHPQLAGFKYLLTVEEDNLPPPDGLLKLMEHFPGEYAAVGGLYFTKGEAGVPQIWGDPKDIINFRPQVPQPGTVQECHGLGMGFTLFDLDMFRSGKIERPFFKTVQQAGAMTTQDLYFAQKARSAGFRFAVDTNVRVGHLDNDSGMVW